MNPTRRGPLLVRLAVVVAAPAAVTPVAIELSRPLVHDWADTVGFTLGVAAAVLAIGGLLRGPGSQPERTAG